MKIFFDNIKNLFNKITISKIPKTNLYFSIGLFLLALAVRLFMFGFPRQFVFDEVYFINFISNYFTGTYYFDIHPALGKLLMYGWSIMVGFKGHPEASTIGESFANNSYLYLRLFPIFCGSLLSPVIFLLAKKLKMSTLVAFFIGIIIVFENSLVVESRFVLMDSSLILFGFLGIYLYFCSFDAKSPRGDFLFKLFSGISLAFAFGIKWTGLTFLAIVGLIEIYRIFNYKYNFKKIILSSLTFILIPIIIYLIIFAIHFSLLTKPGSGDAFMTKSFNSGESSFASKFIELNKVMYTSNKNMTATHSYSSKWYTWPVMKRGIYYWQDSDSKNSMIYLFGNPFIYWFALLGVFASIIIFIFKRNKDNTILFLVFGYLINLLPFSLIERPMFLYHYFPALIFAILCLGYSLNSIKNKKVQLIFIIILTAIFIWAFLYFSPLTYGIDNPSVLNKFWLSSWR